MDEAELINQARQGSESAWAALIRAHQEPVFRLAYLCLGHAHDAEDLAQDVFVRAFRNLDRFDDARPLRPWLLQITRNLASNRRRSWGRYWRAVQRLWADQTPQAATLEAQIGEQAEAEILWQHVQQLKPPDQEVIYLRYFLELSVAETAAALEIAEGTVKSRLSRALARLPRRDGRSAAQ